METLPCLNVPESVTAILTIKFPITQEERTTSIRKVRYAHTLPGHDRGEVLLSLFVTIGLAERAEDEATNTNVEVL